MQTLSLAHRQIVRARPPAVDGGLQAAAERSALACANPHCPTPGRAAGFRFEGNPACSAFCAQLLLRTAVSREQEAHTAATLKQRPRVMIGRILVDQGTITEAALERALRSQRATGAGRLGLWLKAQESVSDEVFTAALAVQSRCPVFRLGSYDAGAMALYLPKYLTEEFATVPLRLSGEPPHLSLCFEDRVDYVLVEALRRMHGVHVDAGLLTHPEFWQASGELARAAFPRAFVLEAPDLDTMIGAMARALEQAEVTNAQLVLINSFYWLRYRTQFELRDVICSISAHAPALLPGELAGQMLTPRR